MKLSKKAFITAMAVGSLSFSAVAAAGTVIQDVAAKFNPGIKYTLDGQEILKDKGALVYEDRVYIPVRDTAEALGISVDYKDETVILKQAEPSIFIEKSSTVSFKGKTYTIKTAFPEDLSEYISLDGQSSGQDGLCLIKFEKGDKTANIGSFTLYEESEYDAMDPTQMPVPAEVYRKDGIVVGFTGIQDSVFDPGTEEAGLVEAYYSQKQNILKTFELI